jgi:hypothetical protein
MIRQIGLVLTIATLAILLWQLATAHPVLPPLVSGILLVIVSLLAGIRIGTESIFAYAQDLRRINKVLAEQNRELEELNRELLSKLDPDSTPSA